MMRRCDGCSQGKRLIWARRKRAGSVTSFIFRQEDAEEVERMDSEIRTVGNIDEVSAEILQLFDYAALGHIHKPMKLGSECIRYCGTMLACSVSEAGQAKRCD